MKSESFTFHYEWRNRIDKGSNQSGWKLFFPVRYFVTKEYAFHRSRITGLITRSSSQILSSNDEKPINKTIPVAIISTVEQTTCNCEHSQNGDYISSEVANVSCFLEVNAALHEPVNSLYSDTVIDDIVHVVGPLWRPKPLRRNPYFKSSIFTPWACAMIFIMLTIIPIKWFVPILRYWSKRNIIWDVSPLYPNKPLVTESSESK